MGLRQGERARTEAERGVGGPKAIGQPVEPALAVGLEDVAVAVEIGNIGDVVARQAMFYAGVPRLLRRRMDRPEMAGEFDLLVVAELLAVKDHDRIPVDRGFDGV